MLKPATTTVYWVIQFAGTALNRAEADIVKHQVVKLSGVQISFDSGKTWKAHPFSDDRISTNQNFFMTPEDALKSVQHHPDPVFEVRSQRMRDRGMQL